MILETGGVAEGNRRKLRSRSRRWAGNEVIAIRQFQLQHTDGHRIDVEQPRRIAIGR